MNPSTFIPIIALWLIIAMMLRRRRRAVCIRSIIEKRKKKGNYEMKELATKFIGKDCIIYAFDGSQYTGTVKEVTDGALLMEKDGGAEAINLDFVLRIREHPTNKKGKKKSVVLD